MGNYDNSSKPNTIELKLRDLPFEKELFLASGKTILPGQVLEFASATTVQPQSTKHKIPQPKMVAIEFAIDGRDINSQYAIAGETVVYNIFQPGEEFYGWLAAGQNVSAGDLLDVDNAGNLIAAGAYTSGEFCRALQTVNNSTGGAAVRIEVEVL